MTVPDHAAADWDRALKRAASSFPALAGAGAVFLEQREDLVLEAGSGGVSRVDHWRACGLAVQGPFDECPHLFVADPRPEDATALVRATAGHGDGRLPRSEAATGGAERPDPPWLSVAEASSLLEGLLAEAERFRRGAEVRARWIGFDQRMRVARPHQDPVEDRRTCRRVRLEASRPSIAGEISAAADVLVPGESGRAPADLRWLVASVMHRLDERRNARAAPGGPRAVVFAPGVGGVLAHELIGHALEGDVVASGASWLSRLSEDERCGPACLTVLDDPRRGRAAWRVDDEGTPVRPVPLVRAGRIGGKLHDLRSATHAGQAPTGHGRRASFRDPVRARMGCTFVAAGNLHPDEVLRETIDGVYVRRMEHAGTDVATGRAVFRVTDADRIHHGRLGVPLRPHLLVVEGRAALASVDRVAFDLAFDTCMGSCLRDGQPMSSSVGAPTFRIGLASVWT
jgi:predicted Zn-dependent protease